MICEGGTFRGLKIADMSLRVMTWPDLSLQVMARSDLSLQSLHIMTWLQKASEGCRNVICERERYFPRFQNTSEAFRSVQNPPEDFKRLQKLQKLPEGSRSLQKISESSRSLQKAPEGCRSLQKVFRRLQKASGSFHKAFRSLQNAPNLNLTSHTWRDLSLHVMTCPEAEEKPKNAKSTTSFLINATINSFT